MTSDLLQEWLGQHNFNAESRAKAVEDQHGRHFQVTPESDEISMDARLVLQRRLNGSQCLDLIA